MVNNSSWRVLWAWLALGAIACQTVPEIPKGYQGIIEFEAYRVGFEFGGRVHELKVDVGSTLKAGEVIATLDDSLERAQIRVRDSEVIAAQQRVALVKARSRPEEIEVIQARIRAASALEAQLRHNLDREQTLVRSGAAPRATAEDINSQLERAVAQRQELEQSLKLLLRGARKEEVAQADAQAQASQANADALVVRLLHYQATSPIAGDVLQVYAKQGETVTGGSPVVAIADPGRPYAEIFVPQAEITKLSVGKALRVRVDGLVDSLPAQVEWIARETEFTPRYLFSDEERSNLVVRVRVRIQDSKHELRAGIPAFVTDVEPQQVAGALDR
jgi:HlyD family secretion protein